MIIIHAPLWMGSIEILDGRAMALPSNLDIAALRLLVVVNETGSFTAAADRLGINQSTVSYSIGKLRTAFADPLFVRQAGRQVTTARGAQIIAGIGPMLERLDSLARPQQFDPAQADGQFTLTCNYYERLLFVPPLVRRLRDAAPGLRVSIIDSRGRGIERLLALEADMMIGPYDSAESGVYARALREEEYVCLMDPAHPLAEGVLSIDDYLTLEHIHITYEGRWRSRYLVDLAEAGHALPVRLTVPSPAGVARLIEGTRLVATLPRRLAEAIGEGLAIRDCPVPGRFSIAMVWPQRHHRDAMQAWLRALVVETVGETVGGARSGPGARAAGAASTPLPRPDAPRPAGGHPAVAPGKGRRGRQVPDEDTRPAGPPAGAPADTSPVPPRDTGPAGGPKGP